MSPPRIRILFPLFATAGAVFAGSCASPKAPAPEIPVGAASRQDLSVLVGKWKGEYSSPDTGRSGSIVFELKSGGATANGDVLMWPKGSREPSAADATPGTASGTPDGMPQVLSVSFVQAAAGRVSGTLRPYVDPDCVCEVRTVFVGTVRGDRIEGTFTTERSERAENLASGVWSVTRQKS